MPDDFLIARNPDPDSRLPYLLRIPVDHAGVVVKARDTWPRTGKVFCHPADGWPADPELLERVPVRVCRRRGAAIDLVLDRGRESRSMFVFTTGRGREMIFWQTARTSKQARPRASLPTARAQGIREVTVLVDSHERYAWNFAHQQVTTRRQALAVGDYAVDVAGSIVAAVERKSLDDLGTSLTSGKLGYVMAELAGLPHAAVVVEERYSKLFGSRFVSSAVLADAVAECQARHPAVPIIFAETRALAQEWTYRFFGAVLAELEQGPAADRRFGELTPAGALPAPAPVGPTTREVRAWARANGITVPDRGRLRPEVWQRYEAAHPRDG